MEHHIIRKNTDSLSRKSLLIVKTFLWLSFLASMLLFVYLSMECINAYQVNSINKMIKEQTSISLSPFESTFRSKHNPRGVNKKFGYNSPDQEEDSIELENSTLEEHIYKES